MRNPSFFRPPPNACPLNAGPVYRRLLWRGLRHLPATSSYLSCGLLITTVVIIIRKNKYGNNFNPSPCLHPLFTGHSVAMILAPPPSPDTKYALQIGQAQDNPSLDSQILEDILGRGSPAPFWSNQQKPILSVEAVIIRRAATISNV